MARLNRDAFGPLAGMIEKCLRHDDDDYDTPTRPYDNSTHTTTTTPIHARPRNGRTMVERRTDGGGGTIVVGGMRRSTVVGMVRREMYGGRTPNCHGGRAHHGKEQVGWTTDWQVSRNQQKRSRRALDKHVGRNTPQSGAGNRLRQGDINQAHR